MTILVVDAVDVVAVGEEVVAVAVEEEVIQTISSKSPFFV